MKKFNLSKGLIVGLLTFALCIVAFAAVGASAAEEQATVTPPNALTATYSYADNAISCASNAVVYVLKQEKSNVIKKGAAASGTIAAGKSTALVDLKVKGTTKDVYLYVCDKEFEDEGKVDANLVIKAQAAKKVIGKIDYTKADDANATNVLSITATDKNKKAIEGATCIWSAEIDGTYAASTTFTGAKLAKMLEDGGGVIYVKMVGANDPAQFASKAIKVKIAKQAKAPKIKYDEKKDSLKLGNGYDFGVATKNGDKYTVSTWYTILPVLKDSNKKTAAESIVATASFLPCDKKDTDVKDNTTQYKFKLISMDTIIAKLNGTAAEGEGPADGDFTLAVRKSATAKKPASEVLYVEYKAKTQAPIVWTASNVAGEYDIATVTDFDKKGFTIGTIANYNGEDGTEGFWNTFALKKTAGTGADKNAAAYEFCVVKQADLAEIDWTTVSWKKLDPAKTKINGKLKTKYSKIGATSATEATLKAFAKPNNFSATAGLPEGIESILLVRRAGVKGDAPVRPSDAIMLYVIKDGKNYTLYSTEANGESAKKYTVSFFKYSPAADGHDAGFYVDETIAQIVGYTRKTDTPVKLDALTGAGYFKLGLAAQNTGLANLLTENEAYLEYTAAASNLDATENADAIPKGSYTIHVDGALNANTKINIAIREYATATVKAVYGEWKDSKFVPIEGEAFTKEAVAYVKDGKVAQYDSTEKKLVLGNTVSAYIGSEVTIPTNKLDPYIPGGYVFDSTGSYKIAGSSGEGYTGLRVQDNNVYFTIEETGDIVVEISVCIKPIVVTVNANTGKIKDGETQKDSITLNPGLDGKITLPAEADLVPPTNKVFDSFNTKADGTGDAVTGDKVYSADTTIYVKWKDAPAG